MATSYVAYRTEEHTKCKLKYICSLSSMFTYSEFKPIPAIIVLHPDLLSFLQRFYFSYLLWQDLTISVHFSFCVLLDVHIEGKDNLFIS